MSETTPLTTPAAMLVPLSFVSLQVPLVLINPPGYLDAIAQLLGTSETRCDPGATMSGFWKPSYHVGPRELYQAISSSLREGVWCVSRAPTVIAPGEFAGDVIPPYP